MATNCSWIVRIILSVTPFCSGLYGVVSSHLMTRYRQKSMSSSKFNYASLSDRRQIFSFRPYWFLTIVTHSWKITNTWSFVLVGYAHTFLVTSSINVTKFDTLPRHWCGIGLQTSKWIKLSRLGSLIGWMDVVYLSYW